MKLSYALFVLGLLFCACAEELPPTSPVFDMMVPRDIGLVDDADLVADSEADQDVVVDAEILPDLGCVPASPPIEVCDGLDDDCDDAIDEDVMPRGCWDGPAGTQGRGECRNGLAACENGSWGVCEEQTLPQMEACNALDDDCDGIVDEDAFIECGEAPEGGVGECRGPRQLCEDGEWGDCGEPVGPVEEVCDGLDNNCDGTSDEGFLDTDEDGIADCVDTDLDGDGVLTRLDNCPEIANPEQEDLDGDDVGDECDPDVDGDGFNNEDDCEPAMGDRFPGAPETCNAADDDCDTMVDEAVIRSCYEGPEGTEDIGRCTGGFQDCTEGEWNACNGQELPLDEVCDGIDQDCDGNLDEGLDPGWLDEDMDGFGNGELAPVCPRPAGYADNAQDCDDARGDVNPDVEGDVPDPDFVDANCDGLDGQWEDMVFVHVDADPEVADGTVEAPFADLESGLVAASERGGLNIALAFGVYPGRLVLRDGISIYGGYDAASGWIRSRESTSSIRNDVPDDDALIAVFADGINEPTELQTLSIETADVASGSTYGVWANDSSGLRLVDLTVQSGTAGSGVAGLEGMAGTIGEPGQEGAGCGGDPGQGGTSACMGPGFVGGRGGGHNTTGSRGEPAGCGGGGGDDGFAGRGDRGGRGCDGQAGESGVIGMPGTPSEFIDGLWMPGIGGVGTPGGPGLGGGGGGGGGGGAVIRDPAGSGGGGGGAGCGGGPGSGGTTGGGSFGVLVLNSPGLLIDRSTITSGAGGRGGAAGAGGLGGEGGNGGRGGRGGEGFLLDGNLSCGGVAAGGHGGRGGRGGNGGNGGEGRSGDGGPSFSLVCIGAAIELVDSLLQPGPGGDAGEAGTARGVPGARAPSFGCD